MRILFSFLFVFAATAAISQNKLSDRIYFGGGGGFSASSSQTNISVFPQVGYRVSPNYIAGVGITYQYVKIKQPIEASLSNYGWSLFNRYNVTRQFFAYAEFERLNFEYFTSVSPERKDRLGYNSLLLGAGYSEPIGGNAAFSIMALYNVLYDESDLFKPYNSPWVIRAGIGIGVF